MPFRLILVFLSHVFVAHLAPQRIRCRQDWTLHVRKGRKLNKWGNELLYLFLELVPHHLGSLKVSDYKENLIGNYINFSNLDGNSNYLHMICYNKHSNYHN